MGWFRELWGFRGEGPGGRRPEWLREEDQKGSAGGSKNSLTLRLLQAEAP